MILRRSLLGFIVAAGPALAQTPPSAPAMPPPPAHRPARPAAAKKPTPVVQAPPNTHAQRPAAPAARPPEPPPPPPRPAESKGTVTGLPLPRWAALRTDEVNLRVGPGTRFPIEWQYHRRDLPIEILREVDVWRLIEDQDGVKGWVHQATLVGHRGFVVRDAEAILRRSADDAAAPVARLKRGVVGRIRSCQAQSAWCEVQVDDYRGFLHRDQFWGTFPGEPVNG